MNIIRKAYDWIGNTFQFTNGQFQRVWMTPETKSGIRVSERSALQIVAIYRAASIICGAGAALPIDVTERTPDGRRVKREDHPVERLLDVEPNPEMSTMDLRHFLWMSYLLWGNGYALIVRRPGNDRKPIGLWPLQPDCMEVKRNESTGELVYLYTPPNTGTPKPYGMGDILHVRGLSLDGINGISAIQAAAESLGLNQAIQHYAAKFMSGGAAQRLAISFPNPNIQEDQIEQLRRDWASKYGSIDSYDRPVILKAGGTATAIGINPRDAMLIELMQLTDERCAMLFGIPPHMLGLVSKTTSWGTGIGEQKQGFHTFTMQPHLVFHEKAYERCLLDRKEESQVSIKHNVAAYLRSDYKGRMEGHVMAVDHGILNRDEARALEDLEPIPGGGGQIYTVQQQYVPIDMTGEIAIGAGGGTGGNANA